MVMESDFEIHSEKFSLKVIFLSSALEAIFLCSSLNPNIVLPMYPPTSSALRILSFLPFFLLSFPKRELSAL